MKPGVKLILFGGPAIVAFDTLASSASLLLCFPYAKASFVSTLIYGITGFMATRIGGWKLVLAAGAALGLVDATLGWGVSWLSGPGKPPTGLAITPATWPIIAATVILGATVTSAVGGALGRAATWAKLQSP